MRDALSALALVFAAVMVAVVLTGFHMWDFSRDCAGNGGTFSRDGGTAWCRY